MLQWPTDIDSGNFLTRYLLHYFIRIHTILGTEVEPHLKSHTGSHLLYLHLLQIKSVEFIISTVLSQTILFIVMGSIQLVIRVKVEILLC